METLDHTHTVWFHIFRDLPLYAEREKKPTAFYCTLVFTFADGGNRTRATCEASECLSARHALFVSALGLGVRSEQRRYCL